MKMLLNKFCSSNNTEFDQNSPSPFAESRKGTANLTGLGWTEKLVSNIGCKVGIRTDRLLPTELPRYFSPRVKIKSSIAKA